MAMNIKIGVDLDGLTFGDLYGFVDLARGAGVLPESEVRQVLWSEQEPDRGVKTFEAALPGGELELRKAPDFSGAELDKLIWALDDLIEDDGDARKHFEALSEIRDRLRG
jgi:hypothetical protein